MDSKSKKISIQLTEDIHTELKKYCDKRGLKLNRFIEMSLKESITGSIDQEDKLKKLLLG